MAIAQTSMIAACLAVLVYIAIIVTGNISTQDVIDKGALAREQSERDSTMHEQISTNLKYVHKSDTSQTSSTILLNGVTLRNNEFILLYDSTPYASKGHMALNMPCHESDTSGSIFEVLVGQAPDLTPLKPGYIQEVSSPPDTCIYHIQFGFGDPITDIALKNVSGEDVTFRGPHAVVISVHESYIPTAPSFKDIQHERGY